MYISLVPRLVERGNEPGDEATCTLWLTVFEDFPCEGGVWANTVHAAVWHCILGPPHRLYGDINYALWKHAANHSCTYIMQWRSPDILLEPSVFQPNAILWIWMSAVKLFQHTVLMYSNWAMWNGHMQRTSVSQPMKFITTRCSTMWAKMKSANARSGEMLVKWILFCGLLWIRRHTVGVCMCVCVCTCISGQRVYYIYEFVFVRSYDYF